MDRNIQYLLDKYQTKQPGEKWTREHELEYKQDYRLKQKIFLLEGILNTLHNNFHLTKLQKDRIIHLIKELNFYYGHTTDEQVIVMLIVYVKLETQQNRQYEDYMRLLDDYKITINLFVRFLISLNQYHIQKIPLPYQYG